MTSRTKRGACTRGVSPCFVSLYLCSANLRMHPHIWIQLGAKGMNQTSKGKSQTEARWDNFSTDRTNSKNLSQTLL